MRILIWGCGNVGHLLESYLRKCYTDLEVLGFIDRDMEKQLQHPHCFAPEHAARMFRRGLFDAVVVGVAWEIRQEVSAAIQDLGMVEWSTMGISYTPAETLAERTYRTEDGRVKIHEVANLHGIVDQSHGLVWLHKDGFIVDESFNYLMQPLRLQIDPCRLSHLWGGNNRTVVEDSVCVIYRYWAGENYWHFLFEAMDKVAVMESMGYDGKYLALDTRMARSFFSLSGVEDRRVLWVNDEDDLRQYVFRHAVCPQMINGAYESATHLCNWANSVAERVADGNALTAYPKRTFVKRIGKRKLLNCEDILKEFGFATIIPEELSIEEQIKHFRASTVAFSPHGAGSANCLFMRDGMHFIESFGRSYVNPCCMHAIHEKHLKYHMIVERTKGIASGDISDDYELDENVVRNVLESIC